MANEQKPIKNKKLNAQLFSSAIFALFFYYLVFLPSDLKLFNTAVALNEMYLLITFFAAIAASVTMLIIIKQVRAKVLFYLSAATLLFLAVCVFPAAASLAMYFVIFLVFVLTALQIKYMLQTNINVATRIFSPAVFFGAMAAIGKYAQNNLLIINACSIVLIIAYLIANLCLIKTDNFLPLTKNKTESEKITDEKHQPLLIKGAIALLAIMALTIFCVTIISLNNLSLTVNLVFYSALFLSSVIFLIFIKKSNIFFMLLISLLGIIMFAPLMAIENTVTRIIFAGLLAISFSFSLSSLFYINILRKKFNKNLSMLFFLFFAILPLIAAAVITGQSLISVHIFISVTALISLFIHIKTYHLQQLFLPQSESKLSQFTDHSISHLNDKQLKILKLILIGATTTEICDTLILQKSELKEEIKFLLNSMGCSSISELLSVTKKLYD